MLKVLIRFWLRHQASFWSTNTVIVRHGHDDASTLREVGHGYDLDITNRNAHLCVLDRLFVSMLNAFISNFFDMNNSSTITTTYSNFYRLLNDITLFFSQSYGPSKTLMLQTIYLSTASCYLYPCHLIFLLIVVSNFASLLPPSFHCHLVLKMVRNLVAFCAASKDFPTLILIFWDGVKLKWPNPRSKETSLEYRLSIGYLFIFLNIV